MKKDIKEQTYWDNKFKERHDFRKVLTKWVGGEDAPSKRFFINYIKNLGIEFKKCLDVGCGPATEYNGFKKENIILEYLGVDSSKNMCRINSEKGIPMLEAHSHKIPLDDNSYDMVISRHVLEHQPDFCPTLSEMIRISNKFVSHTFFVKPGLEEKKEFREDIDLYPRNQYRIVDIEDFLKQNEKVKFFEWHEIPESDSEILLTIWIKS